MRQKIRENRGVATAARLFCLTALAVAGCAKHAPVVVQAPAPPPAPVGHIYPTMVEVPPPVSPRITFTPNQQVQVQQAFNVISLKSALMVAALSCNDQPQYDQFMLAFQPHILAEQHVMDKYFYKASGPYSGRKMEDNFVTLLANNQSVAGIAQGSIFCLNNQAEFNAVLALKTPQALDDFVTDQAPPQNATLASAAPVTAN